MSEYVFIAYFSDISLQTSISNVKNQSLEPLSTISSHFPDGIVLLNDLISGKEY